MLPVHQIVEAAKDRRAGDAGRRAFQTVVEDADNAQITDFTVALQEVGGVGRCANEYGGFRKTALFAPVAEKPGISDVEHAGHAHHDRRSRRDRDGGQAIEEKEPRRAQKRASAGGDSRPRAVTINMLAPLCAHDAELAWRHAADETGQNERQSLTQRCVQNRHAGEGRENRDEYGEADESVTEADESEQPASVKLLHRLEIEILLVRQGSLVAACRRI